MNFAPAAVRVLCVSVCVCVRISGVGLIKVDCIVLSSSFLVYHYYYYLLLLFIIVIIYYCMNVYIFWEV